MADYRVVLSGEDKLSPTIKTVRNELNNTTKAGTKLDEITRKFQKIQTSAAPLQSKLKSLKSLMAEMNLDGMTDTGVFSEMAQQAGVYADALGDASTAVRQFADDNMSLNAAVQGMQLVASTASLAQGAMGLFGIENENVNEAILKVQSSLAILNGLQTISNVLNKDSALMLQLQALATAGSTVTTQSFTAALSKNAIVEALATAKTKISTVCQTAWNVAKAIGMAMLGNFTGLALLAVGAVVGLTVATKSDTDATEENNQKKQELATTTEYLAEKSREASDKINSEAGKLIASYRGLQVQFNSLGSDVEKAKWLEENKNKFQQLGFEVDNVIDAENFFNKSSSKVIDALKARAKAAAMYQLYLEALQKQYELNNQTSVHYEWEYTGAVGGKDYNEKKEAAYQAALEQLRNDRKNQNAYVQQLERDMIASQQAADAAAAEIAQFEYKPQTRQKSTNSSSSSSSKEKRLVSSDDNQSLKFAQDMVSQIKKDLEEMPQIEGDVNMENAKKQLALWEQQVEHRKVMIYPEVELPQGSLEYAQDMLSKAQDALNSIDLTIISDEDLQLALSQVDTWKKEVEAREIKLGLKVEEPEKSTATIGKAESVDIFDKGSLEDQRQSLANAKSMIDQIRDDYSNGFISLDEATSQIDVINAKLAEIGVKPIEIHVEEDGTLTDASEHIQKMQEDLQMTQDALSNVGDAFSNLGGAIDGTAGSVLSFAGQTMSSIAQMLPQILALIGGNFAEAMSAGTASAAALPFPANLGAIASIVATIAGISAQAMSLKDSFADGGIVQGSTFHGDNVLVRANAGEMILNKAQQANLFNALDSGRTNGGLGGNVEFKISGSTLKGVLTNYENKISRMG